MIKIGLLGSESYHAFAFSKLCNVPDKNNKFLFDNVRVTAICGDDDTPEHTEELAKKNKIPLIVKTKEELFDKVDAVMVLYRQGSLHVSAALPFIERKIPVWIDKAICETVEDIEILRNAVEKHKALITGGSTLRYNYEVLTMKNKLKEELLGKVSGGVINHNGDLNSIYGGLFFYGPHIVEILLDVFGYDPVSVNATVLTEQNLSVAVKYIDKLVILNINNHAGEKYIIAYGSEGSSILELDDSMVYKLGFEKFVEMLRSKLIPFSFEELVKSVYVIDAINKSIKEMKEIKVK